MESYQNRDKKDVLKYLWLVQKENKHLNEVDQWCIVLPHGDFDGMELHGEKIWVNVTTDIPDTTYSPINDPSVKNTNKKQVSLGGEEETQLIVVATLSENINKLRSKVYKANGNNKTVNNNIPKLKTKQDNPTYKYWFWVDMNWSKVAVHRHERARLSRFGEESIRGLTYLTTFY